eukprot:5920016-Pleurochrysis_carterae.AAC.1
MVDLAKKDYEDAALKAPGEEHSEDEMVASLVTKVSSDELSAIGIAGCAIEGIEAEAGNIEAAAN